MIHQELYDRGYGSQDREPESVSAVLLMATFNLDHNILFFRASTAVSLVRHTRFPHSNLLSGYARSGGSGLLSPESSTKNKQLTLWPRRLRFSSATDSTGLGGLFLFAPPLAASRSCLKWKEPVQASLARPRFLRFEQAAMKRTNSSGQGLMRNCFPTRIISKCALPHTREYTPSSHGGKACRVFDNFIV